MSKDMHPLRALAVPICAAMFLFLVISTSAQQLQVLHNHVRPAVSNGQAVPLGSLPATQRMSVAIMLPVRNQAGLTSLLNRLYDPSSPDYHHFLTVEQFTEQFGPTAQDFQAVIDFANANGLTVTDTPSNRLLLDVSGQVSQIESAFHVSMNVYQHPTENRTFFSPDREPSLALSVPVWHIAGLNNFSFPHSKIKRASIAGDAIHGNATGSGPNGAYRPSDMRAAYYGGTALTGAGQTVGLVEFDGYNMADVTGDLGGQTNTVPIVNVLIDGASAASDGDDGEQALDVAQPLGMAPGLASERVYIAPGTTAIGVGDADMFNRIATDNIAKSMSCSFGWNPDDTAQDDPIFQEFATQGQVLFVASGDSGAFTGNNATDDSFPAEDPFVVAVGGTDLTTNGAGGPWESETAWPDSSGGPADNGFALPSYQTGIANSSNGASTTIRNIPDVAAEANFDNILCDDGTCTDNQTGGTSYASPRWAGFIALVNQQAVANGKSTVGFINPAIYAIGLSSSFTTDFHDITSGNNNNGAGRSFNAVAGYDLVTGWGSPNGQNLINALAGPVGGTVSLSPTSLSFGNVTVNTTSAAQTVTLTNSTSSAITITSIATSAGFAETNTCGTSVAANSTCTISVTFAPTATGAATGTLTVTDSATNSPQTASLSGTGVAAGTVTLTPASLAFGNVTVNTTSTAQTATLTNSTTSAITITSIAVTGAFADTTTCGTSLAANTSCTISVTFKPTATGTLTVTDSASNSPQTSSLSGTGVAAGTVTLTPASVNFGTEVEGRTSAAHTFTLTNGSSSTLTISSITLNSSSFTGSTNCPTSLAAAATCTITLEFRPRTTGTITGTLTVNDNASNTPQTSALTGVGER